MYVLHVDKELLHVLLLQLRYAYLDIIYHLQLQLLVQLVQKELIHVLLLELQNVKMDFIYLDPLLNVGFAQEMLLLVPHTLLLLHVLVVIHFYKVNVLSVLLELQLVLQLVKHLLV
jgi:hypothetical protein